MSARRIAIKHDAALVDGDGHVVGHDEIGRAHV